MILGRVLALLCASAATADYVVDWRVPQANDANANAWVADVVVPAGEKVVLEWTDYFAFHNVYRMKDKAAYDACDFDGAVELAPSAATGSVTIEATETIRAPRRRRWLLRHSSSSRFLHRITHQVSSVHARGGCLSNSFW